MRYVIKGADKQTGEERTITVVAVNEEDAAWQAERQGLFVSAMKPGMDVEGLPSRAELLTDLPMPTPTVRPAYDAAIIARAKSLDFHGTIHQVIGFMVLAGSLLYLLAAIAEGKASVYGGFIGILVAIMFFGLAAVFNLLAALALAHRDLVQNSFTVAQK